MEKSGRNENRALKTVLACDMFTAAYYVMPLLFFLPFVAQRGQWIAAAFVPLGCIIPFAVMPLLYALVHRFDPLLFGRYHLFMPISAFLAAFSFVEFWSADDGALGAVRIALGFSVLTIAAVTYRYCSFSVRVRLTDCGIAKPSPVMLIFSAVGGAAGVGAVIGFYFYDPDTVFINAAYVVAGVCVILAMVQYLTSFYYIPKLSGKRVQSVKSVFRAFFGGLNVRLFVSSALAVAAFSTVLALAVSVCSELPSYAFTSVAAVAAGGFIGGSFLCVKLVKRRSRLLTAVMIGLLVVSAALFALTQMFVLLDSVPIYSLVASAALCGVGTALAFRQMRLRFLSIKPHVTSGVAHILIELACGAGTAIAFAAAVAVGGAVAANGGDMMLYVYGFASAVVLGIASVVTSRIRRSAPPMPDELSYEPTAAVHDIGAAG
ncbi:MAG: hypothetical protein J1G38_03150 [Clostridiales bacterium]|nr:hypothetical protein [Clostridiales bacterium]